MTDSFADAWREGYVTGGQGAAASTNPHPAGADLALDWADGWREGAQDRERSGTGGESSLAAD